MSKRTRVLLLGAGNIGDAICHLLSTTGDYQVIVADQHAARLAQIGAPDLESLVLDVSDEQALRDAMAGKDVVLSACPYYLNASIAEAARQVGLHYFDLTEDVETTRQVRAIAEGADKAFVPQCGLAPGFISIVAANLAKRFDSLRRVRMRVGALPLFPVNALKYNLTWNTDGLINEYCNLCQVIYEGSLLEVLPLEGHEEFSLDGVTYEAFNTSGGLGTLADTLAGKLDYLDYKTIRYPGHCELVKFLVYDLQLGKRRDVFKEVVEHAVPATTQDVVLVFVTASGMRGGRLIQESYSKKVYHQQVHGRELAAIQLTTAAGVCAMIDLLRDGKLPHTGFVRQEEVALNDFLTNRFGEYFA